MVNSIVIQGQFPGGKPNSSVILLKQNFHSKGNIQRQTNGNAFRIDESRMNLNDVGSPLPNEVLQKMESLFNTDLKNVKIHTGGKQAESIGAMAFTSANNIYFASGQYNPQTTYGQRLLGHELTHVVQQKKGLVVNPFGSGITVIHNAGLEAEAERMSLKAVNLFRSKKCPCGGNCGCKKNNAGIKKGNGNLLQPLLKPGSIVIQRMFKNSKYSFRRTTYKKSGFTERQLTKIFNEEVSKIKKKKKCGPTPGSPNWHYYIWNGYNRYGWDQNALNTLPANCANCGMGTAATAIDHIVPYKVYISQHGNPEVFCDGECHYLGIPSQTASDLYNDVNNLQPLCTNCNSTKASNDKKNPHNVANPPDLVGPCPSPGNCPDCNADHCL